MFNLPKECIVDRFIPKKTFYERVNISSSIKQEFIGRLEKITWKYKLCENNINISNTDKVEEIEIFELILKEKYDCKNIIKIITKNIPYPILFKICYNDEVQYAIKYNEDIYFTDWNKKIDFTFNGMNLSVVYENIIRSVTNISERNNNIEYELEKNKKIKELQTEIERLENKVRSEKQFNKKVELNQKLKKVENILKELKTN